MGWNIDWMTGETSYTPDPDPSAMAAAQSGIAKAVAKGWYQNASDPSGTWTNAAGATATDVDSNGDPIGYSAPNVSSKGLFSSFFVDNREFGKEAGKLVAAAAAAYVFPIVAAAAVGAGAGVIGGAGTLEAGADVGLANALSDVAAYNAVTPAAWDAALSGAVASGAVVGPIAAGADTLTVSTVGDAALPGGAATGEAIGAANALSDAAAYQSVSAAAWDAALAPVIDTGAAIGEANALSDAAAYQSVAPAVWDAALAPATVATGAGITLGDAASAAKVASSVAGTAATVGKLITGQDAPTFASGFTPAPQAGALVPLATSPAAALFSGDSLFTVLAIAGAALVLFKLLSTTG